MAMAVTLEWGPAEVQPKMLMNKTALGFHANGSNYDSVSCFHTFMAYIYAAYIARAKKTQNQRTHISHHT